MTSFQKRFCTGSLFFFLLLFASAVWAERYSFVTRWQIAAPADTVWEVIQNVDAWPEWWKGVRVSRINGSDTSGRSPVLRNGQQLISSAEGALDTAFIRDFSWRGRLPYRLRFTLRLTDRIHHRLLAGKAWGDLEGTGIWYFREEGEMTYVECHWDVETCKPWMNRFAWLLRGTFRRNHDLVMQRGAKGLARRLQAQVQAY